MNWPPLLMRLGISDKSCRLPLWLPLFLIYPIVAAVAILLAPLVFIAAVILLPFGWGKRLLLLGPAIFSCLCALRGLEVNIKQSDQSLLISFK